MNAIIDEYSALLKSEWVFLHEDWPVIDKAKLHRTEVKEVLGTAHVKSTVLDKLGFVPAFFFLACTFGTCDYSGPYRNVEKGLLLLYSLISGESMTQMARFMPKTSYYDLHKDFYLCDPDNLIEDITSRLFRMCSNLRLRLILAKNNPDPFKHVTLNLDGHDTRVSHIAADKPSLYLYKLKKSGFRVQVCTDMNNFVLFVSKPAPCRDYNDGTMLVKMNIASRIHKLDCIAVDGGYNGFINQIVESSDILTHENFSCPVRKTRGITKSDEEVQYNNAFGGFRSNIESCFGDMQSTFSKFTHNAPIRFSDSKAFDLQYKLCCLLMNIKKFVEIAKITTQTHHTFWLQDKYDFPDSTESHMTYEKHASIKAKLRYGRSLLEQQEAFMLSEVSSRDSAVELADLSMVDAAQSVFEVARILDYRGEDDEIEYLVQWRGYPDTTWEPRRNFNHKHKRCINDYWKSKASF